MNEYIKRAEAIAIVEYAEDEHPYSKDKERPETYSDYNQGWSDACDYIECRIEAAKSADVAPVRHAKWIEYPRAHYFKCSECKYTVPHKKAALISGYRQYNYCPHCGAKMDREDNDEVNNL